MADPRRRHPANAAGPWFVDTTCIDCDACRQLAPSVFDGGLLGQSAVREQPASADELRAATRALVACPTASIGIEGAHVKADGLFPEELEDGGWSCGLNSPDSFGAQAAFAAPAGVSS